jgi:hypothetical protein
MAQRSQVGRDPSLTTSAGALSAPQRVVLAVHLSEDLNAKVGNIASEAVGEFERQIDEQRMRNTASLTINQASRPNL